MEFATSRAEKSEFWRRVGIFDEADTVLVPPRPPKAQPIWMKEFFPTVWSDNVTEQRLVIAAGQPVRAGILMVRPAGR